MQLTFETVRDAIDRARSRGLAIVSGQFTTHLDGKLTVCCAVGAMLIGPDCDLHAIHEPLIQAYVRLFEQYGGRAIRSIQRGFDGYSAEPETDLPAYTIGQRLRRIYIDGQPLTLDAIEQAIIQAFDRLIPLGIRPIPGIDVKRDRDQPRYPIIGCCAVTALTLADIADPAQATQDQINLSLSRIVQQYGINTLQAIACGFDGRPLNKDVYIHEYRVGQRLRERYCGTQYQPVS